MACGCGDWRKRYNLRLVHTTLRNMQRPAIGSCEIENFPFFCSDLQLPSPRRPLQQPATSVNKPYQGYTSRMVTHFNLNPVIRFTILSNRVRPFSKKIMRRYSPRTIVGRYLSLFPPKMIVKLMCALYLCALCTQYMIKYSDTAFLYLFPNTPHTRAYPPQQLGHHDFNLRFTCKIDNLLPNIGTTITQQLNVDISWFGLTWLDNGREPWSR